MAIIESLIANAGLDTALLKKNDGLGDDFSVPRLVDFVFTSQELNAAEVLAEFVADNQFGKVRIEPVESGFRVLVSVEMPVTQHVICSVSGMMVCLAALFKVDYDGWGCVLQRR